MVPRKGSAKAPFFGLDEVVSMKWSWGYRGSRNAPLIGDATASRGEWVSRGAIAPDPPERIDGCRESEVSRE